MKRAFKTRMQFADAMEINPSNIYAITNPRNDTLLKLKEVLDLSNDELVELMESFLEQ